MIVNINNAEVGTKVIRGRDWTWADQDWGSIYGVVTGHSSPGWVRVEWVNASGDILNSNVYRIGAENAFDLYLYKQ